jgi:hypothetical protein
LILSLIGPNLAVSPVNKKKIL